ncbi:unnamed protein product [Ostreobium quekettii]|uniref:Uncharacterized protein n=1 Tax=Ostreobium quekettii TaxID=121088 RepID=A0A8S1IM78_9CHLO|nr:unnamed protein product [Ostreobium quekettii]|eukprot:evm.model.scf_703.3 EVM.evm.TU.scf_703.3   scf_703:57625-58782(-)
MWTQRLKPWLSGTGHKWKACSWMFAAVGVILLKVQQACGQADVDAPESVRILSLLEEGQLLNTVFLVMSFIVIMFKHMGNGWYVYTKITTMTSHPHKREFLILGTDPGLSWTTLADDEKLMYITGVLLSIMVLSEDTDQTERLLAFSSILMIPVYRGLSLRAFLNLNRKLRLQRVRGNGYVVAASPAANRWCWTRSAAVAFSDEAVLATGLCCATVVMRDGDKLKCETSELTSLGPKGFRDDAYIWQAVAIFVSWMVEIFAAVLERRYNRRVGERYSKRLADTDNLFYQGRDLRLLWMAVAWGKGYIRYVLFFSAILFSSDTNGTPEECFAIGMIGNVLINYGLHLFFVVVGIAIPAYEYYRPGFVEREKAKALECLENLGAALE